jgi:hypothetical protein
MFKTYNICVANSTESYVLSYEIYSHAPAQIWAEIMSRMPITYLRPNTSPWFGVGKPIEPILIELKNLVDQLNEWMPEPITLEWDSNDHQAMVNKYHTHFPKLKDHPIVRHRQQLTRYNDIMHDIENLIRPADNSVYLMICPDPPGNVEHKVSLALEHYNLFTTDFKFGELYMGYSHIGRHPVEIYHSNDLDVPHDQILPQNVIGPIHYLYFHNNKIDMEDFGKFYRDSGLQWPYELEDPRLAVGMICMGKLKSINGEPSTEEQTLEIIKSCDTVTDWNVQ